MYLQVDTLATASILKDIPGHIVPHTNFLTDHLSLEQA